MTDNLNNTNRLEDEDLDQVAGGVLRSESSDYYSRLQLHNTVIVSDPDIQLILESGFCPSCNGAVENRLNSYSCAPCNTIYRIYHDASYYQGVK